MEMCFYRSEASNREYVVWKLSGSGVSILIFGVLCRGQLCFLRGVAAKGVSFLWSYYRGCIALGHLWKKHLHWINRVTKALLPLSCGCCTL
jgi:hypothetical protein